MISMAANAKIANHAAIEPRMPKSEVQRHIRNALTAGFKKRKVNKCAHPEKPYYAKSMCVNCYHRLGRTKTAWSCPHRKATHYSKGLCKHCYLSNYYKKRTIMIKNAQAAAAQALPDPADSCEESKSSEKIIKEKKKKTTKACSDTD